jgi:hypothetical protein
VYFWRFVNTRVHIFCPAQVPDVGPAPGRINIVNLVSPEAVDVVSVSSSSMDLAGFESPEDRVPSQRVVEVEDESSPDLDWLDDPEFRDPSPPRSSRGFIERSWFPSPSEGVGAGTSGLGRRGAVRRRYKQSARKRVGGRACGHGVMPSAVEQDRGGDRVHGMGRGRGVMPSVVDRAPVPEGSAARGLEDWFKGGRYSPSFPFSFEEWKMLYEEFLVMGLLVKEEPPSPE